MKKSKKEMEFEKVVTWDDGSLFPKKKWNDKQVLIVSLLIMIPIIGQILWVIMLFASLCQRKVTYVPVKKR